MSTSLETPLGTLLPEVLVPPPGPRSRALAERLRQVESPDVTRVDDGWPVFWEAARGANVLDVDGNRYVDMTAAFGVMLLGHGHPGVLEAIGRQAPSLVHGMGDVHPPAVKVELLGRLAALMPWSGARTVLGTSGSDAVEAALKTALMVTGRPGVLAFEGAYHGLTLGSLAATHRDHFRAPFRDRLYGGVSFAPFPVRPEEVEPALAAVDRALARGADNGDPIGAVLVEPVQGRGGVRIPADGFMATLSGRARRAGAVLIADEVFTGAGRCGAFLASARVGLEPDLVCLGKALGGGLPLSACVGRSDVMEAWPPSSGEAVHTSTFLGHPLACAAALAVLDALEREDVPARAEALGRSLVAQLGARLEGCRGVRDVRGLGLMVGIELTGGAGAHLARAALAEGLLVLPAGASGEVVELVPPVCLTGEQAELAVEALARTVAT